MTDEPARERIKTYMDDLAGLAVNHGLKIDGSRPGKPPILPIDEDFGGYYTSRSDETDWSFFTASADVPTVGTQVVGCEAHNAAAIRDIRISTSDDYLAKVWRSTSCRRTSDARRCEQPN